MREEEPFSFDFSDIKYTEEDIEKDTFTVEILPSNYEEMEKKFGKMNQHSKTELLRYTQTIQPSDFTTLKEAYVYLSKEDIPIVVPQEYINIYMISKIYEIFEILKNSNLPYEISHALEFQTRDYTQMNICRDIEEKEDCTAMISLLENSILQNSTIPVLTDWILFTDYHTDNEYERYVHKQLKMFSLNTDFSNSGNSDSEISSSDIYWDLDYTCIQKILYLYEYTKNIYEQTGVDDENADLLLNEVDNILNSLISGDAKDLNPMFPSLLTMKVMDTENEYDIYLNMKIEQDEEGLQRIYILPMYVYEDSGYGISDENFNEEYEYEPVNQLSRTVRVPILMYHQISDMPEGSSFKKGLYVTPEMFEKQMAYLVKMNYKTITTKEFYSLLASGENPSQKTVVITFDDSIRNQYTEAYPILKKYGLTAVFYVVSGRSGITSSELKEMSDNGMEIGSHTVTHIDLVKEENDTTVRNEIFNSKYSLQSATGKTIYSIAYPGCVADTRAFEYANSAGYLTGMSCGKKIDHRLSSRLSISRVHVFNDMVSFKKLLSGIN